jgi:hypothetical protein
MVSDKFSERSQISAIRVLVSSSSARLPVVGLGHRVANPIVAGRDLIQIPVIGRWF